MSVDGNSNCNADGLASTLFTNLTAGTDFTLPAVDLSSVEYLAPSEVDNPLYGSVSRLEEADLTARVVGGSGLFDGLMVTINTHLKSEYDKGRITGTEYSSAYVSLTQTAMSTAVQFLLSRDQAYWQAIGAQKQAQAAEIEVVNQRVNLENTKATLAATRMQSDLLGAQFAVTKLKLSTEDAQYCLLQSQKLQSEAQTAQIEYQTTAMMPAQVSQTTAQTDQITAQKTQVEYETQNMLPAQLDRLVTETSRLDYEIASLLPAELSRTQKQIDAITADIAMTGANQAQTEYQTTSVLPSQVALTDAQKLQVEGDIGLTGAQKSKVDYDVDFLMPQQLRVLEEQVEIEHAKISDTQTDGVTLVSGLTGAEKRRTEAQTAQINNETDKGTYELTWLMPAQLDRLNSEVERIDYEVENLLPAELGRTIKQTEAVTADISLTSANRDQALYQTANTLPAQKAGIEADTALKDYQLTTQLPAQVAGVTEDTRGKAYTVDFMMPAQLESVREQTEAHRAKTLDTRSDGVTLVAGSVGKQKDLHQQQIDSYKRDAEQKVAKMVLDTWMTQKSLDDGILAPDEITNDRIDSLMTHVRTNLDIL